MYYLLFGLFIVSISLIFFSLIYVPVLNWKVIEDKLSIKLAIQKSFTTYFFAFSTLFTASALNSVVQSPNLSILDWVELFLLVIFTSFVFTGVFTLISYLRLMRGLKIKSMKIRQ